ncbi:unnamed protein product [Meganyctiphanes norvegica]|uniref:Uncharacterized protein n=1 Tax=Meganyctiphanes norvegica TaxID=48144 RepID=A0AAV2R671_MEGNR
MEIKKKTIVHHRGNRKNLADEYSKKLPDISDGNYHGEEANVYSKVGESSKDNLDPPIISSIFSRETTKNDKKGLVKTINNENEFVDIASDDIDLQGKQFENPLNTVDIDEVISNTNKLGELDGKHDYVGMAIKQKNNHEEIIDGIEEESVEYDDVDHNDDDDDDDSYILSDMESFWDAVDTFINIHSPSEHHEKEDPQEAEDLYEYLYTPSGNSPGIDNFLDLLLFVKDLGDAVEKIGQDTQGMDEKDSIFEKHENSPMEISNVHEVNKIVEINEDINLSHEGYEEKKDAKEINTGMNNRSKRSSSDRSDSKMNGNGNMNGISYQHKPFKTSLSLSFKILRFDLLHSSFEFVPFEDPYPDKV